MTPERYMEHLNDELHPHLKNLLGSHHVDWIRWDNLPESKRETMHPRYVMSDLGGIKYDFGTGRGKKGETCDLQPFDPSYPDMKSYDSRQTYSMRWPQYCASSKAFEFTDGFRLSGDGIVQLTRSGQDGDSNREFVPLAG